MRAAALVAEQKLRRGTQAKSQLKGQRLRVSFLDQPASSSARGQYRSKLENFFGAARHEAKHRALSVATHFGRPGGFRQAPRRQPQDNKPKTQTVRANVVICRTPRPQTAGARLRQEVR